MNQINKTMVGLKVPYRRFDGIIQMMMILTSTMREIEKIDYDTIWIRVVHRSAIHLMFLALASRT